jgi:prevent-host-death family protein
MKKASIRDVQHHLSELLERVARGEEITVTRRGQPVARLVPPAREEQRRPRWPDFEARLEQRFPKGPPPGPAPSKMIEEDREERA